MEITELRIGNLVDWATSGATGEPQVLTIAGIVACSEDGEIIVEFDNIKSNNPYGYEDCNACDLRPIPLTEDWLHKCGIEKISGQNIWNVYAMDCFLIEETSNKNEFYFRLRVNPNTSYGIIVVKYVHQLQNLIFAMTGAELKIV